MSQSQEIKLRRDMAVTHATLWAMIAMLSWPLSKVVFATCSVQVVMQALIAFAGHMTLRELQKK